MLTAASGEQTMGRTEILERFSRFKTDATSKDAQHFECPLTSKTGESVDRVKELVLQNRKITIHKVDDTL